MKRAVSLYFILIWSLSTARSFQPQQPSKTTTIHKDLAPPLKVSTTVSGSGARRFLQDWASKIAPVHSATSASTKTNKNHRASIYEPAPTCYQQAKDEWADRYTNLDSLRETFGANRNKLWGDLDPATARRLYKTLLPRALLELVKVGVEPEDLAPLAYQARVAAKLYARERCQVPARVFCQLFDGFRQFKKYGKFQTCGMSYDQIWAKYQQQLLEATTDEDDVEEQVQAHQGLTEDDVTAKICLKILERSCTTNENVDRWVLPPNDAEQREDLIKITQTLENDVRKLLDPIQSSSSQPHEERSALSLRKYRTLRLVARARRRAAGHYKKLQQQHEAEQQQLQQQQEQREDSLV